jgi:hypothetical protein
MGIEVVGEPLFEFAMALVAGIGDCLEELAIAPRTTDVLGHNSARCTRSLATKVHKEPNK